MSTPSDPTPSEEHSREQRLAAALDRLAGLRDPWKRRLALLDEAQRLAMEPESLEALQADYGASRRTRRGLVERWLYRLARRFEERSFFEILEYVGRLAIVVAILSFFLGLPERRAQAAAQRWQAVSDAAGKRYAGDRVSSLEELDRRCFPMQGLQAPGAELGGLALDRCYRLPGGSALGGGRLGPALPFLYRYHGADLRGADLSGAALSSARLPGADLVEATLRRADLAAADLSGALLSKADLSGADLTGADLSGADLHGADLTGASLFRADLSDARLHLTRLCAANFVGARLVGAELDHARGCSVAGNGAGGDPGGTAVNFSGADLEDAQFYAADLRRARFERVRLDRHTAFDRSDLGGASFRPVRLPGRDFFASTAVPPPRPGPTVAAGEAERPGLRLALLTPDEQYFYREVARGAARAVAEDGAATLVEERAGAGGWTARRLAAVAADADAMVLPMAGQGSDDVVELRDAGIFLACYDQCPEGRWGSETFVVGVESSGERLGRAAGRLVRDWRLRQRDLPERLPVLVLRSCGGEGCFRRVRGLRAALSDAGLPGKPMPEAGYRVATDGAHDAFAGACALLRGQPDSAVLWAANEHGTEAAVAAVRALGREDEVVVFGIDWSPRLAAMLTAEDGVLQGVVAQDPEAMGHLAAQRALAAARHEWVPYERVVTPYRTWSRWTAAGRLAEVVALAVEAPEGGGDGWPSACPGPASR